MIGLFKSIFSSCRYPSDAVAENDEMEMKLRVANAASEIIKDDVASFINDDVLMSGLNQAVYSIVDERVSTEYKIYEHPFDRKQVRVMVVKVELPHD